MSDHSYCWSDILSVQAVDSTISTGNSGNLANKHGALGSRMRKNLITASSAEVVKAILTV